MVWTPPRRAIRVRPEPGGCACPAAKARHSCGVYYRGERRMTYWLCLRCGREWTVEEWGADRRDPITSDEILDLVEILDRQDLRVVDMVEAIL